MRTTVRLLTCGSVVISLATLAGAATVSGSVKGPDGAAFQGAFVQAQNAKTRVLTSVLSDNQGHYRIQNLAAGDYRLQIHAVGYKADPRSSVALSADQNASFDFALQKAPVRWNEISMYQGRKLLPEGKGKDELFKTCFACHGFETRMASVTRDEDGWRDRIAYMREAMHFFIRDRFSDQNADDVAGYLTSVFGPDSILPKSAADAPGYQETVRSFTPGAMNMVYVEYELPGPNRMPWSAAPDKDGNLWMPYYGRANMIGRLNPVTAEVKEFPVPNEGTAAIHSAVAGPDGAVWLTEQGSQKLGRWDPVTQKITEYQDTIGKHTVRVSPSGEIFFSGGKGSFDPKTQNFTHYEGGAYGIALDKEGNVWYAAGNDLVRVDGKTHAVSKYTPPTHDNNFNRRIQVDSDGMVWFAEFNHGIMTSFDPKTEKFREYKLPGPEASPYALGIDKDHYIWYSSEYMDVIGRMDPKTGDVVEYPFPQSENTMREFFYDQQSGRMWFGSPANNKVGYFYLAGDSARGGN